MVQSGLDEAQRRKTSYNRHYIAAVATVTVPPFTSFADERKRLDEGGSSAADITVHSSVEAVQGAVTSDMNRWLP
eukprot:2777991-Rhodomonas_salina.1